MTARKTIARKTAATVAAPAGTPAPSKRDPSAAAVAAYMEAAGQSLEVVRAAGIVNGDPPEVIAEKLRTAADTMGFLGGLAALKG